MAPSKSRNTRKKQPARKLPTKGKVREDRMLATKNKATSAKKTDDKTTITKEKTEEEKKRIKSNKIKANKIAYTKTKMLAANIPIPKFNHYDYQMAMLGIPNANPEVEYPQRTMTLDESRTKYYDSQMKLKDDYIKALNNAVDKMTLQNKELHTLLRDAKSNLRKESGKYELRYQQTQKSINKLQYLEHNFIPGKLKAPVIMKSPPIIQLSDDFFTQTKEGQDMKKNLKSAYSKYPEYSGTKIYT